jgi:hypothetical protein
MSSVGGGRRLSTWLVAVAALLGAASCAAFASTPAADAADGSIRCGGTRIAPASLRIDGILGVANTFAGTLRVTAVGKPPQPAKPGKPAKPANPVKPPFLLLQGPLLATGTTGRSIGTDDVTVTNVTDELKKGQTREIEVTVEGARFVGEYSGTLQAGNGQCPIPFTVVVAGAADLSLVGTGTKTLSVQVVSCDDFTCGPGEVFEDLTRETARKDEFAPQVDNGSQSPAEVTAMQVALNRSPGAQLVPAGAVAPTEQAFTLPPLEPAVLEPIEVKRDELEPGRYTGAVYLTLRGAEKRVVLPLELDVKSGPFWAILVLLAALFVQLLVWFASRSQPRGAVLRELREAARKTRGELDPEDWALLEERFAAARDMAIRGKLTQAKEAQAALAKQAKWLPEVRDWVAEIKKANDGKLPKDVRDHLRAFQRAIEEGNQGAANSARTDLRNARSLENVQFEALQTDALREDTDREAAQGAPPPPPPPAKRLRDRIDSAWYGLWDAIGHPVRSFGLLNIYVLPWLLRALLVLLFVLAGLKELYFDNTTFGVDPVLNYSALFLWGIGATAVNVALGKVIPATTTV